MLSRVADRMYWLGRYTERAENTARLLSVNANLALDLPRGARLNWSALLRVTGSQGLFGQRRGQPEERSVVHFLLAEPDNPGSLLSSLDSARENARTTREVISSEAWEHVNDLYLDTRGKLATGALRSGRHAFLQGIISGCQQLTGIMSSTMSHDHAYNFAWLGRTLERADMTTRILDLAGVDLLAGGSAAGEEGKPYESLPWVSVLRSLGAYQTYRRNVQARVVDVEVVRYLLQDKRFPRSVSHCQAQLETCLRELPGSLPVRDALGPVAAVLQSTLPEDLLAGGGLHGHLDHLQLLFNAVHAALVETWLRPPARRSAA